MQAILRRFPGAEIVDVREPEPVPVEPNLEKGRQSVKNLGQMMKQVQEMQSACRTCRRGSSRRRLPVNRARARQITLNGKGALKSVAIDPSLLKIEERKILEDSSSPPMPMPSQDGSRHRRRDEGADGGLPLPPGFSLPH